MAFFGLDAPDLEAEKRKFQQGGFHQEEDLAVYTWGEDGYDGLGDALQEGGDDFNDETFGGTGPVGKDFDFSSTSLPPGAPAAQAREEYTHNLSSELESHSNEPKPQPGSKPQGSLESIWENKSPFSVLMGSGRHKAAPPLGIQPTASAGAPSPNIPRAHEHTFSSPPGLPHTQAAPQSRSAPRTLQEIEAEMLSAARTSQRPQHSPLVHEQPLYQSSYVGGDTPSPRVHVRGPSDVYAQQEHLLRQQALIEQQQLLMQQDRQRRLEQQLHEQRRMEEIERQLRAQRLAEAQQHEQRLQEQLLQMQLEQHQREQYLARQEEHRLNQLAELQQQAQQQFAQVSRRASPAMYDSPSPSLQPQLAQNVQMQQRLLYELSQAEFLQRMNGGPIQDQETLRAHALQKIMEAERLEEKRRRRLEKIRHMSRYNDLMTQSDKDFITRIQVSQLVTSDPYAEDFYAQVWSHTYHRQGGQANGRGVLKFGGGGVATGVTGRGAGRRPNALQRMEQQVERIVQNAKLREKEKGGDSINHSLQGALGKTAGRSYKAAPRQLLQVDGGVASTEGSDASKHAANSTREVLGKFQKALEGDKVEPLTRRECLLTLERLYDLVMSLEQHNRSKQADSENLQAMEDWEAERQRLSAQLWDATPVRIPWNACVPHPLASLLGPAKGKRLLPRIIRHLNHEQGQTAITLIVLIFGQLDVVVNAPLLDNLEDTRERQDVDMETDAFYDAMGNAFNPVIGICHLRYVTGMIGVLCDHWDITHIAQTGPGTALLTLFLSRVRVIMDDLNNGTIEPSSIPTAEEFSAWEGTFDRLFQLLSADFRTLFPSTRITSVSPDADPEVTNMYDQGVWQFLAILALFGSKEQHSALVLQLREKLMELMMRVKQGWITSEEDERLKLGRVKTFLTSVGLNMSQILALLDR